jgi:hypothetical protein
VASAAACCSSSRTGDNGVTSRASRVPASSSPAIIRAPRPMAKMMNSTGSMMLNSSALRYPAAVVIASMLNNRPNCSG